ncbi:hypothetical protein AB0F11_31930 [Streptomyces sp. NPDC032472]|uniref:hypothetical protein n=1 Tax=Streptomyces sp. NPDC032472 TaxID=3155018 RepID=UPI0033C100D4
MYVLQHLLESTGLRPAPYEQLFATRFEDDFGPQLATLLERRWLREADGALALTLEGMARADAVGLMFFSDGVHATMRSYRDR